MDSNPFLFMGDPSEMTMGDPKNPKIPGPENVNTSEDFVKKKEEQCAAAMAIINESIKTPFNERAFGCIVGAFCGDSCGSYLEFYGGTEDHKLIIPSEEVLDTTMKMPGGGYHGVAPGQVTDDSELMQCLLWGYVESNKDDSQPRKFDLDCVSERYGSWFNSNPFDIGMATTEALKAISYDGRTASDAIEAARMRNANTKSNGSLMRCMPHSIFLANMAKAEKYQEIYDLVSIEANFVHTHKLVHEAIFVYTVSVAHLLNNPDAADRAQVAFDKAYTLAKGPMCTGIDTNYGEKLEWWLDESKGWADAAKEAKKNGEAPPYLKKIKVPDRYYDKFNEEYMLNGTTKIDIRKMQGFMKWAICLSYYYLQMASEYELNYKECIREIISLSGDTDTNACIAGAVVGALLGFNKIDPDMVKTVLQCDCAGEGQIRPQWLSVGKYGIQNAQTLIEKRAGDSYQFLNHPDKK